MNKYNFENESDSIYLSVKQSENHKSAVADVPDLVGSLFSDGYFILAFGIGLIVGAGGVLATQAMMKKKGKKS